MLRVGGLTAADKSQSNDLFTTLENPDIFGEAGANVRVSEIGIVPA